MKTLTQIVQRPELKLYLQVSLLVGVFVGFVFLLANNSQIVLAANLCPSGGYYCGNDGLNADANTLYRCTSAGSTPQVNQSCSYGCHINPPGTPDACNPAPSGACPSSGWYCGGSVGQNSNNLYYCSGSGANPSLSQSCSNGCHVNPPGTPDACNPSGPCPSSGYYCGGSVGQNANNLYYCSGSGANPSLNQSCSNGCHVNSPGTPDVCNPSGACPSSGYYCGGSVGQDANNLYYCSGSGANPSLNQTCSVNGCQTNAPGTPDVCRPSGACPSSGYYCGGSVGQDANNLYSCSAAGANPTLNTTCSYGCHTNSPGTADVCNSAPVGLCPSGGYYCGTAVGQNINNLYTCSSAGANPVLNTACSNGCHQNPPGTPDVCNAPVSTSTLCPTDGYYCGSTVNLDPNNLYVCSSAGATPQLSESCSLGCHINPPGTRDVCNTGTTVGSSCPNGNGYYCGGAVGLNPNTLYQCASGNYTVSSVCSNGCQQSAPGTADFCKSTTPVSTQQIIFPMQTGTQNVSDFKVEPGYTYGTGPFYIWTDCDGVVTHNNSINIYHGGIDIIANDAKGTLEVDANNPATIVACKKGSFGANVVAIGSGTLTAVTTGSQGTVVTLLLDVQDLGRPIYATYEHLNVPQSLIDDFNSGDPARRHRNIGDQLGTVGNFAPYVSNPHLHFQLTRSSDWGGGYSSTQNPDLDDNEFINPCAFFLRHGATVPANCPNVTPNGGQIASIDSDVVLTFPPNAVNQDLSVQLNKLTGNYISPLDPNLSLAGNAYQFTALTDSGIEISNFNQDVDVVIKYNQDLLNGKDVNKVTLYYFEAVAKHWVKVAITSIDTVAKEIHAKIPHFSEYAVMVENTPPVVTQIPTQTITSGQTFSTINLGTYGSDPDTGDTLTWSYTGNTNISVSIAGNIATLTYPSGWNGSENITFTATDTSGATAASTATFSVNSPASGTFTGQYFNNTSLSGTPVLTNTTPTINYSWSASPGVGVNADNFSIKWTGTFNFATSGDYTFIAKGDDGIRAFVDGVQIINGWVDQGTTEYRGLANLTAGLHNIEVDYYDSGWDAVAIFNWVAGNQMPAYNACTTNIGEWCATYYNNTSLSGTPIVTKQELTPIDYDWGNSGAAMNVISDNFTARWTGTYTFLAGNYTFTTVADDGVRVYIDGNLVIDRWSGAYDSQDTTVAMTAGNHAVKVEFLEYGGSAYVQATWAYSGGVTNNPPTITSSPVTSVNENAAYVYDVNATDPENNTLTYSLTQSRPGMTINSATGLIAWTPSYSDAGTYPITVSVSDGTNSVSQAYNLVVNNVNRSPVVTQIPGQTITTGQSFATINLPTYGSDPDADPLTWGYSGNANISVAIANSVATLTYTGAWIGSESITFTATDNHSASANSTATFTVNPVAGCAANQYTGQYFNNKTLSGSPTLTRCDNALNFDWGSGSPDPAISVDNFSARWTYNLNVTTAGSYQFTINADDGDRLYVDGNLVINNFVDHGTSNDMATVALTAGTHALKMEYYEAGGGAVAKLNIQVAPTGGTELLPAPWHLTGNNGASELYQSISSSVLAGKTTLRITYDLHGLNALGGDASAIIFDQNGWKYISLSNYGINGKNGSQTVDIPLSAFSGLNLTTGSTTIHTRFWYGSAFTVDITSIKVL